MARPRSVLRWAVLAVAAVVLLAIGTVTAVQLAAPPSDRGPSGSQSGACSPKPCLNLQGYTMWVADVRVEGDIVRMQVTFRNSSDSTHAAPEDLELINSTNATTRATQDPAGCTHWGRTEFNNGARFGPITVCFQTPSTQSPLKLRWAPDMGFFCCDAVLKIQ